MTINPYALKEFRQMVRSKAVASLLFVFLFASAAFTYLIPFCGICLDTGSRVFACVMFILAVALVSVLPVCVYARMEMERGAKGNADFTLVTPLPVRSVIDGKIASALAVAALFAAAALPFAACSHLLHGVTLAGMATAVSCIACLSCAAVCVSVAIASMKVVRGVRICVFALFFLFGLFTFLSFAALGMDESQMFSTGLPLRSWFEMVAATATVCIIARGLAIAFFSPTSMERDVPLRVSLLAAALFWSAYQLLTGGESPDRFFGKMQMAACEWAGAAVFAAALAAAQKPGRSRRILAGLPKSPVRRMLFSPLSSGAANGFLFAALMALPAAMISWLFAPVAVSRFAAGGIYSNGDASAMVYNWINRFLLMVVYVFAALLIVRALWRRAASSRPGLWFLAPVVAFAAILLVQTVPKLLDMNGSALADEPLPFCMCGKAFAKCPLAHCIYAFCALAVAIFASWREFRRDGTRSTF